MSTDNRSLQQCVGMMHAFTRGYVWHGSEHKNVLSDAALRTRMNSGDSHGTALAVDVNPAAGATAQCVTTPVPPPVALEPQAPPVDPRETSARSHGSPQTTKPQEFAVTGAGLPLAGILSVQERRGGVLEPQAVWWWRGEAYNALGVSLAHPGEPR